jgi:hypothetical protein
MQLSEESFLFKDIPYTISSIIDIGIWVNKMINNNLGGEINAQ